MLRVSLLRVPLVFVVSIAWLADNALTAPRGYWQPGGYEARIGSPYYYSVPAYGGATAAHGWAQPAERFRAPSIHSGSHHGCACYGTSAYGTAAFGDRGGEAGEWTVRHHLGSTDDDFDATGYGYPGRGTTAVDPYTWHFGPGYYRYAEHGHFRFPYYSYRRPWYFPGAPVFNRDTNFAW